jgi:uncharacterized damage-inducible protein DinB
VSDYVALLEAEYQRYKALGEAAMAQLTNEQLSMPASPDGNSVAAIVWHVAGNLESRFTDFRTSDGEKPWRNRDEEFSPRVVTAPELLAKWDRGWRALFTALEELSGADLTQTVTIRRQSLRIDEALHRSLAHTVYHVGQIVFLAKQWRGDRWSCLSIPLGGSAAHNQRGADESAAAHARALGRLQSIQPPPTTTSSS